MNVTPDQHSRAAETRKDGFLNDRVRLVQPTRGYRAGLDAALLAAAVELAPGERALEAGCGAGAALFQLAARAPAARLAGLERDENMLALARENARLNGVEERVELRIGDVAAGFRALGLPPFDAAFANPPFFDDPGALRAPSASVGGRGSPMMG